MSALQETLPDKDENVSKPYTFGNITVALGFLVLVLDDTSSDTSTASELQFSLIVDNDRLTGSPVN